MSILGTRTRRRRRNREATPEEEYEALTGEERRLQDEIRDLEGFIEDAPSIKEERLQETRVTLPPPEEESTPEDALVVLDEEDEYDCEDDLQERVGRRHIAAMHRERRKNFCVFLVVGVAVAAFLYWVSQVVQ